MDRNDQIKSLFDTSGFGLEIGPSYSPILPKRSGFNVKTLDYASQEDLQRKYARTEHVNIENIEPIDYVSDGRPMVDVIPETECFDYILASHVIEHTPDLIGFLKSCEQLLKPGGVLVLAFPDKRCCFDMFLPLTTTGEILNAHRAKQTRPNFGSVFNEVAYDVKQDGVIGWTRGHRGDVALANQLSNALWIAERAEAEGNYVDVHVWRFVPASFRLAINDLRQIGIIGFGVKNMIVTDEILVTMEKGADAAPEDRLALLKEINNWPA